MDVNPVTQLGSFKVPESNVFLMTRFRAQPYHQELSDTVADAAHAFGLELIRADDPNLPDSTLWHKVRACMEASHYGVAVFEDIDEKDFNPNVSLELGYMMALRREHLLLKEQRLAKLPTDLCGHLYKEFDSSRIRPTLLAELADWFKSNGVRKRDQEKLVVFVSYGGTDRCAVAKAITDHLLLKDGCTLDFRIASRAAFNPAGSAAAKTGIEVVENRLGEDRLSRHRPRRAGPAFLFEADLILATDNRVLSKILGLSRNYPGTDEDQRIVGDEIRQKSHLISHFFGGVGKIDDPYPDLRDLESKHKYERCFDDLYRRISDGLPILTEFLERDSPPKARLRTVNFGDRRLPGTVQIG
jgi:protein-tyrosine-phosphatase